ncbi:MAG: hypothetical protein IT489_07330 [Gammaproteobacteria bacterium]|nr:hypothetical protein [Gammaproteobacteria bacterium]
MKISVILDKSFLDGASTEAVRALCEDYVVLVSDELFFELITTRPESQQRCFSKLPDKTNPVYLIPNVGSLLRFEIEQEIACTPVVDHRLNDAFQFSNKLRDGSFIPDGQMLQYLEEWKSTIGDDTRGFIERWSIVHQFFPEINGIEWKEFPNAIKEARQRTATDVDFIRGIYASFLDEDAPRNAPRPDRITPEWAFFRWVQCQILCSLRLFGRYQGKVPDSQGGVFLEKAEHSMLDSYHVIHGSLVGAMATLDEEIREDLLLLRPTCLLIPPTADSSAGANYGLQSDAAQAPRA